MRDEDDDGKGGAERSKKRSTGLTAEERSQREELVADLVKKLDSILHLLNKGRQLIITS